MSLPAMNIVHSFVNRVRDQKSKIYTTHTHLQKRMLKSPQTCERRPKRMMDNMVLWFYNCLKKYNVCAHENLILLVSDSETRTICVL